MTPEELNKNAKLSQDALDRTNLKLALMKYDTEKVKCKDTINMLKTFTEHEEEKTFVATVSWCVGFGFGLLCGAVMWYFLTKN